MTFFTSSTSFNLANYRLMKDPLRKLILLHSLFWFIYITYELLVLYNLVGKLEGPAVYIVYYTINILFFYGQVRVLNIAAEGGAYHYWKGLLFFIGMVAGLMLLKFCAGFIFQNSNEPMGSFLQYLIKFLKTSFARAFYFIMLGTLYWAASHISHFRKRAHDAEREQLLAVNDKLETEARLAAATNAYLTQQLNPHLLFNTLNFIYNSVYEQSPQASRCVLLLSDIMRFSLDDAGADGKVPLTDEIEQLKNLIEINRFRYNKALFLDVKFELPQTAYRIIPLVLMTLAENLFKHGNLKDEKTPALMHIRVDDTGRLRCHICNLKKSRSHFALRRQIGLQNTRVRLDFSYPGNYELVINEDDEFYELWLNLQL